MKELINNMEKLVKHLVAEKGPLRFFALFRREGVEDRWDLLISAPWFRANHRENLGYLADQLARFLKLEERLLISRVVIYESEDPDVERIRNAVRGEGGTVLVQDSNFFGLRIKEAYLFRT